MAMIASGVQDDIRAVIKRRYEEWKATGSAKLSVLTVGASLAPAVYLIYFKFGVLHFELWSSHNCAMFRFCAFLVLRFPFL